MFSFHLFMPSWDILAETLKIISRILINSLLVSVLIFHQFTYLFQYCMHCYYIQYLQMVFFSYNYLFLQYVSNIFISLQTSLCSLRVVSCVYVFLNCYFTWYTFSSLCAFLFIVLTRLECYKSSLSMSIYSVWLTWLTRRQRGKCTIPICKYVQRVGNGGGIKNLSVATWV